ncbi:MAG TPA: DUF423 domain-containing protein [Rickettsiales bacterium]|nr:DUF423 domain-containing protein [Rickettsiales bacterium]
MLIQERGWRSIAALNGLMAVIMGAVAAHAVHESLPALFMEKASRYQLIHAVVLLWLADKLPKRMVQARLAFLAGIVLFCGSLYIRALTGWSDITLLAPAGGICLMAGWLLIVLA